LVLWPLVVLDLRQRSGVSKRLPALQVDRQWHHQDGEDGEDDPCEPVMANEQERRAPGDYHDEKDLPYAKEYAQHQEADPRLSGQ